MKWNDFVIAVMVKHYAEVAQMESVTSNLKNRIKERLVEAERALIPCEQKKFIWFFDRKTTHQNAMTALSKVYEAQLGKVERRMKSNTQRRVDDHVEQALIRVRRHIKLFLLGSESQRLEVLKEISE